MVSYESLGELEDAQQRESAVARQRIELAEESLSYYRTRMNLVQESMFELSARHGVADDPGFRADLERAREDADEDTPEAGRLIADLEEDYHRMAARHAIERDVFIHESRHPKP